MKRLIPILLISGSLTACSLLGCHKREKPRWASPEETKKVKYPDSFEDGVILKGPMVGALDAAMNDFLPLGEERKTNDPDKRMAKCLSRRDTYDISIKNGDDGLFYILFFPVTTRCGLDETVLDAGAVYAVDKEGRIWGVR